MAMTADMWALRADFEQAIVDKAIDHSTSGENDSRPL